MSHEEKILAYKETLSAFRKGDETRCPDEFAEAFEALESNPELAAWFEEDQLFDADFRGALNELAVPPLKAAPSAPQIKRPSFLRKAVAAGIALVLGGLAFSLNNYRLDQRSATLVNDLRQSMAAFAASNFELDAMNNDLSVLQELNVSNGGTEGQALTKIFEKGLPMGCKVVDWNGHSVSLYCFGNDKGQVVHAFVVPIRELNGFRARRYIKAIEEYSERDTGGLVIGDTAYLLVSSMPGVDIKPFLLPAQQAYTAINSSSSVVAIIQ